MVYTLRFCSSSKCSLFHNSNVFGSCIIHILYTGCVKLKNKYFRRQKVKVKVAVTVRHGDSATGQRTAHCVRNRHTGNGKRDLLHILGKEKCELLVASSFLANLKRITSRQQGGHLE